MGHGVSNETLRKWAVHVHRLCEGLPALLYKYLNWIHEQDFVDLDRLLFEDRIFNRLTQPYIEGELLSEGSLFGPGAAPTDEERECVGRALRFLVPYRLYTNAHLSQHLGPAGQLETHLTSLGWTLEKLLNAVGGTDLLYHPQPQPWEVIYSPIRRILCRYWYPSRPSSMQAHLDARQFVRKWGSSQTGTDKAVALIECLWHQTQVLTMNRAADRGQVLLRLARDLSNELLDTPGWTPDELRVFAARRISEDEELVEAIEMVGVSVEDLLAAVGGSQA
jgi:hypothetical protein